LALRLVEGPEAEAVRLDQAVSHVLAEEFPDIDREQIATFATAIFDRIDEHCRELAEHLSEGNPEFLSRVKQGANYALVNATLRAMERHLASLAKTSVGNLRQEEDFVRQYKSQLRAAHGYIVPPDFDRRRKIPITNLYVSPDISSGANHSPPYQFLIWLSLQIGAYYSGIRWRKIYRKSVDHPSLRRRTKHQSRAVTDCIKGLCPR
jgi:hypothetical protein